MGALSIRALATFAAANDEILSFGVGRILDGVQALLDARSAG